MQPTESGANITKLRVLSGLAGNEEWATLEQVVTALLEAGIAQESEVTPLTVYSVTNAQRLAGTRNDDITPLVAGDVVCVIDQAYRIEQYTPGASIQFDFLDTETGGVSAGSYTLQRRAALSNGKAAYFSFENGGITIYYTEFNQWTININGGSYLVQSTGGETSPLTVDWGEEPIVFAETAHSDNSNWTVLKNTVELYVNDAAMQSLGIDIIFGQDTQLTSGSTTYLGWVDPLHLEIIGSDALHISSATGATPAGFGFNNNAASGVVLTNDKAAFVFGADALTHIPFVCPLRGSVTLVTGS